MVWKSIQTKSLTSKPLSILINITNKCNLNCKHCFGSYSSKCLKKDISFNIQKRIFKKIKNNNILYVNLSGGEITTYIHFIKLIKYLDKIRLPYYLTTNGVFSNNICNEITKSKYLMAIKISLDGITEKTYEYIRESKNKNMFNKCIENIKKTRKKKIEVIITTLVHKYNFKELNKYPLFLKKLGVTNWGIAPLLEKGRGKINKSKIQFDYLKVDFKKLNQISTKNNISLDLGDFKRLNNSDFIFECGAGINFFCIDFPSKIAMPCALIKYTKFATKFTYNLDYNNFDIDRIWKSKQFNLWRLQQINGCKKCKYIDKCWRCPILNDAENQKLLDCVPLCKR